MSHPFMCYIEEGGTIHGTICSQYIEHGWYSDLGSRKIKLIFEINNVSMRYLAFAISSDNVNWEVLHVQDSQNNVDANVTIPSTYDGAVKFGIKLYDAPPTVGNVLNVGFDYVVNGGIDLSASSANIKKVAMQCPTDGAVIKYTLDGTDPIEDSTDYIEEIEVEIPVTIKARGFKDNVTPSDIATIIFDKPVLDTPTLSLSRSETTVNGTIGNTVSGATYVYKVGSAPTSETDGTVISGTSFSFTDSSALTVYVVGFMDGYTESEAVSASVAQYVPTCATPVISQSGNTVSISCATSGASIYYSTNGSSYNLYTGSFSISSSVTVYAYATASGYNQSATTSRYCSYTAPTCATPSISFSSSTNRVTITCSTSGATIYYRKGTSGSYSVYSGSFTITSSTTIYAYATRSGYNTSSTTSKYCTYTDPTPSLPTPSVTITSDSYDGNRIYRVILANISSFPSGATVTYTGRVNIRTNKNTPTDRYMTVSGTLKKPPYNNSGVDSIFVSFDEYCVGTITITASASGYKSSTSTASFP